MSLSFDTYHNLSPVPESLRGPCGRARPPSAGWCDARARPVLRLEAFLGDELDRLVGELDLYVLSPQAPRGPLKK